MAIKRTRGLQTVNLESCICVCIMLCFIPVLILKAWGALPFWNVGSEEEKGRFTAAGSDSSRLSNDSKLSRKKTHDMKTFMALALLLPAHVAAQVSILTCLLYISCCFYV